MKLKKIICLFCCMLIVPCGCTNNDYKRNQDKGKIVDISLQKAVDKIKAKDSFSIMLTQSTCGYCQDFEQMLTTYLDNHHVIMYNVVLDKEQATPQENLVIIKQYFKDFRTTPGIYYVDKGKIENHLQAAQGNISEEDFDAWVKKYKLDAN